MEKTKFKINATVKEMKSSDDGFKVDVPFASGVDIKKIKEGDKDPLFVTVEAMNPQVSRNKNAWTLEAMKNVAKQVNENKPDAYLGHMKEEDRGYKAPESQTIWLGAKVKELEGKPRLFIKGYILPYAKSLKDYLKSAKAAGKKVAVSIYGQAEKAWDKAKEAYQVNNFDLESIDWTPAQFAGIDGLGKFALTSEMKKEIEMKFEDLTAKKLSEKRPDLVKEIQESAKSEVVSEMKKDSKKTTKEMTEKLDKKDETIKEMKSELSKYRRKEIDSYIDSKLSEEISNGSVKKVFQKLVVSEMDKTTKESADKAIKSVIGSEEGKALVKEMKRSSVVNPAKTPKKEGRKYLKISEK